MSCSDGTDVYRSQLQKYMRLMGLRSSIAHPFLYHSDGRQVYSWRRFCRVPRFYRVGLLRERRRYA